jgi:hypothetical protein
MDRYKDGLRDTLKEHHLKHSHLPTLYPIHQPPSNMKLFTIVTVIAASVSAASFKACASTNLNGACTVKV